MSGPQRSSAAGRDGVELAVYRWAPDDAPRGVVQLVHGMGEHMQRYGHVADALTASGYLVQGHDNRGHGETSPSDDQLGVLGPDGWDGLVADVGVLIEGLHAEHPGLPVIVIGHSMGSFALQQYLLDHSDRVAGAVLTGSSALDVLEPGLDLDDELDLAAFNAPFEPARTDFDWLSRDEAQVDAYIADPRCGFGLDVDGVKTYDGARHEVFNETNRDEVLADLVAWLDRVTGD